jgi:S1-C subfamily serine protease
MEYAVASPSAETLRGPNQQIFDRGAETSQSISNTEAWQDKLAREASLAWRGGLDGIKNSVADVTQHPWKAAAEVGESAAISLAMAGMAKGLGPASIAVRTAQLGLLTGCAKSLYSNGLAILPAVKDTWSSGKNFDRNKDTVASVMGPIVEDTALMSFGSLAGAGWRYGNDLALTHRYENIPVYNKKSLRQLDDNIVDNIRAASQSTVMPLFFDKNGILSAKGSGVIFDKKGLIATAEHVINGHETFKIGIPGNGILPARLLAADAAHDVALLQIEAPDGHGPFPFSPLASEEPPVFSKLTSMGFPGTKLELKASVGRKISSILDGVITDTGDSIMSIKRAPEGTFAATYTSAEGEEGMSGGPVYNAAGEVVGLNSTADIGNNKLTYASIKHVHDLLKEVGIHQ